MENIEQLERRLWEAADQLRANSKLTSTEYYMPVLGLIFLRHAYNRFLVVEKAIKESLPSRGGVTRPVIKEDFDFEEALRDIHIELAGLNEEAVELARTIQTNFEELGI